MSKILKTLMFLICVTITSLVVLGSSEIKYQNHDDRLSINLKSRSLVLGPDITLGDVGYIVMREGIVKKKISSVKVGVAPPPGESVDITLSHIKRCMIVAGFKEYVALLKGPRTIRVVTAQTEIDKAFLNEDYVKSYLDSEKIRVDYIMLVLTRKLGETIVIGDDIVIKVVDIHGKQIRLGIEAPTEISIFRGEIYERIQAENKKSHKDSAQPSDEKNLDSD